MDEITIKFEKDKSAYEQHSESFRSLNTQLWQVPILAMTLTGGLWFGVFSSKISEFAAALLLFFAGFCDILFVFVLYRVRYIMTLLIEKINLFNPNYSIIPAEPRGWWDQIRTSKFVIRMFSVMLLLAAIISFITSAVKFSLWLTQ